MKKNFFIFLFLCCFFTSQSQKQKADSLLSLLAGEKADTNKVNHLWQAASYTYLYAPDSAILLAQKALFLSKQTKYTEGESRSLGQMANGFLSIGNYPRALEFYLKKLQLEETRNNPYNLASVTMNIGLVYVYQQEYARALQYLVKADSMITVNHLTDLEYNINLNLGDVYNRQDQNQSAFFYFNKAFQVAKQLQDGDLTGVALVGLGHSYLKMNNFSMALQSYKQALPDHEKADDEDIICEATLGLAKLYKMSGNRDSSTIFALYSFLMAKKDGFQSRQLEAADFLNETYNAIPNRDSAYVYLHWSKVISDSIYSKDKIRESQAISINEQLRQNEIIENTRRLKEERAQQLQLLLIGLCIPALFLFTLLLSKVKVHVSLINFSGILSLLIFFEYLTLLLHPLVVEFTHHTPFYELLIFVAIASLLIPAHHKIEHWLIEKLTIKKRHYEAGTLRIKKQRLKIKKLPDERDDA